MPINVMHPFQGRFGRICVTPVTLQPNLPQCPLLEAGGPRPRSAILPSCVTPATSGRTERHEHDRERDPRAGPRPRRARRQAGARVLRRRARRRHDPADAGLGGPLLPGVLRPRRRRAHGAAEAGRRHRRTRRAAATADQLRDQRRRARAAEARRCATRTRRSRSCATRSGSTGTRWTPGSRRTRRSSRTPATRTRASTSSPARATCASRSTGSPSPSRAARGSCSRPACRRATTCPSRTSAWTCWCPTDTVSHCPYKGQAEYWSVRAGDDGPRRHRVVVPRRRCPRARRSRAWSPSTTSEVDHLRRRRAPGAPEDEVLLALRRGLRPEALVELGQQRGEVRVLLGAVTRERARQAGAAARAGGRSALSSSRAAGAASGAGA